jgi:hypothetical protein
VNTTQYPSDIRPGAYGTLLGLGRTDCTRTRASTHKHRACPRPSRYEVRNGGPRKRGAEIPDKQDTLVVRNQVRGPQNRRSVCLCVVGWWVPVAREPFLTRGVGPRLGDTIFSLQKGDAFRRGLRWTIRTSHSPAGTVGLHPISTAKAESNECNN